MNADGELVVPPRWRRTVQALAKRRGITEEQALDTLLRVGSKYTRAPAPEDEPEDELGL